MKRLLPLVTLAALCSFASAIPAKRVTNRQYPDGSGSSMEKDPTKRESVETFYGPGGKITHKVTYQLDDRAQPISAIHSDPKGKVFQKSTFKLDGADRIVQEVIYDGKGNLLGTKNYNYGMRDGRAIVVEVDTYDANGNLIQSPKASKSSRRPR
jgi:hypothetical protein